MDLNTWLSVWQAVFIIVAAIAIGALVLLVWLGWLDERDHPEQPTFSPRQVREAKRGNGWDSAVAGRRLPR